MKTGCGQQGSVSPFQEVSNASIMSCGAFFLISIRIECSFGKLQSGNDRLWNNNITLLPTVTLHLFFTNNDFIIHITHTEIAAYDEICKLCTVSRTGQSCCTVQAVPNTELVSHAVQCRLFQIQN